MLLLFRQRAFSETNEWKRFLWPLKQFGLAFVRFHLVLKVYASLFDTTDVPIYLPFWSSKFKYCERKTLIKSEMIKIRHYVMFWWHSIVFGIHFLFHHYYIKFQSLMYDAILLLDLNECFKRRPSKKYIFDENSIPLNKSTCLKSYLLCNVQA
jgi:hypothetical protein